jgi:tetratricopeptide (TPR) repeat protein
MATRLRSNTAFALGHLQRYDDAITAYSACIAEDDQNFQYHSGLGYTAYDSLYAAMKGKLIFHPMARKNRIELAHKHFTRAQQLRPEGITNYYRQGMLFKQIQKTADKALPLFEKAIANWRGNTDLIPSQNIRY